MRRFLLTILFISTLWIGFSQNVVVVVIDGARYTETFGDTSRRYVKYMDSLSRYGTIASSFYNRHKTYTSQAIPALWTGSWAGTRDTVYNGQSTQYTLRPSIFEYYRKQKAVEEGQCIYVLKYVSSLWLQSFYPGYGPQYWPYTVSEGTSDKDVEEKAKELASLYHPQFLWVYLADVDHAGHTGDWNTYVHAIKTADSLVFDLWQYLQKDTFYKENTYLFVTNDHGRHDEEHGGFQGHGCDCQGCQHIMFLALGPDIKQDYEVSKEYETQDFAVTVAHSLGVNPEFADGTIVDEIFTTSTLIDTLIQGGLDYWIKDNRLVIRPDRTSTLSIKIYSVDGKVLSRHRYKVVKGQEIEVKEVFTPGVYILKYHWTDGHSGSSKFLITK